MPALYVSNVLFEVTNSTWSFILHFSRRILLQVLQRYRGHIVWRPSVAVLCTCQSVVVYSSYHDLQRSGARQLHWECVCANSSGLIISYTVSCHRTMHCSQICYRLADYVYRYDGRVVVDLAFCRKHFPMLVKSAQNKNATNEPEKVVMIRQATTLGRDAECGM